MTRDGAGGPGPHEDLLGRVLAGRCRSFALLHRPAATGGSGLDVLAGETSTARTLADIPLPARSGVPGERHEALVLIPYRQVRERGFTASDDGTPLVVLRVSDQQYIPLTAALRRLPRAATTLNRGHFDIGDDAYQEVVRRVVDKVIGTGEGANFVIKRSFVADIDDYRLDAAFSCFSRLLGRETGAYWTFLIHTGTRTLVGASPERHVSVRGGTAVMNPISGTYRYPAGGPSLPGLLNFLADRKETDELYMVVDEELKMMARICEGGGMVTGPQLKQMARLAHTEYFISGHTTRDVREILRETMFAPTVTGSPLENACRVIAEYEPGGRGYYGGVAALVGRDERGGQALDSAIVIRTADIDHAGRARIGVGATLVRHSDPAAEAAETRAKAATLLEALESGGEVRFDTHPQVRAALARRNTSIAGFWLRGARDRAVPVPWLAGRRVLVVDAEDTFTAMIGHQLRALGLEVTVRRFDEHYSFAGFDLTVMGPGPGNPCDIADPRIGHLHAAVRALLDRGGPFLAVCLAHQVLCLELGFELIRLDPPNQGVQQEVDLFGSRERVGFYNTFAALSPADERDVDGVGVVRVSREPRTGQVHALRGRKFASMQFHAESFLSEDGPRILAAAARHVLGG